MTKADQAVDSAADKLESIVERARQSGGVRAKAAQALADDPEFLRKLKPSLIAARARGQAPKNQQPGSRPKAPSAPRVMRERKPKKRKSGHKGGGPNPWLVAGVALAAGIGVAKLIDWRGHAHPRD